MCEDSLHVASPAFVRAHFKSDDGSEIPAFGFPKTNHGWIECISKSFPGQTYYFNVDTCCSTWIRPVSRFIPTRVSQPLNLLSDEDFLDNAPMVVSDIENENDYDEDDEYEESINLDLPPDADDVQPPTITTKETKELKHRKMYAEVLFKLYHCHSSDWNDYENEDVAVLNCETFDDVDNENFTTILPEVCYSSDSDGESSHDSSTLTASECATVTQEGNALGSLEDLKSFDEVTGADGDQFSQLDCLNVLQTSNSETETAENPLDLAIPSAEDSDIGSPINGLSSDSNEEEEEEVNEETDNRCIFSLPRLKAIEFSDLTRSRKIRKKTKKRKASNKENETLNTASPNKMTKIVREVNGVTTVNYDYLEPKFRAGVKISNLSDSGSSGCYDTWYSQRNKIANNNSPNEVSAEATKTFIFLHEPMNFSEPDLSDSSTSSDNSLRAKRLETLKILGDRKDLKRKEIQPSGSSSSSSSSDSSWSNSGSSSDGDD